MGGSVVPSRRGRHRAQASSRSARQTGPPSPISKNGYSTGATRRARRCLREPASPAMTGASYASNTPACYGPPSAALGAPRRATAEPSVRRLLADGGVARRSPFVCVSELERSDAPFLGHIGSDDDRPYRSFMTRDPPALPRVPLPAEQARPGRSGGVEHTSHRESSAGRDARVVAGLGRYGFKLLVMWCCQRARSAWTPAFRAG